MSGICMWHEFPAGTPQFVRASDTPHWQMTLTPLVDAPRRHPASVGPWRSNASSTAASDTEPIILGPRVPPPSDLAQAALTAYTFAKARAAAAIASVQVAGMSSAASDTAAAADSEPESESSVDSIGCPTWFSLAFRACMQRSRMILNMRGFGH